MITAGREGEGDAHWVMGRKIDGSEQGYRQPLQQPAGLQVGYKGMNPGLEQLWYEGKAKRLVCLV